MKKFLAGVSTAFLLAAIALLLVAPARAQVSGTTIVSGSTPVAGTCTSGYNLYNNSGVVGCQASSGSGTVTSVGFTGGLVSVGTPTTTPAFTVAGTSGGIPYFSSASAWASSGLLSANALMVGGGAGVAPSTVTTGAGVLTALGAAINASTGLPNVDGAITTGDCLVWGPGIEDAGAACGSGSSGLTVGTTTITSGTSGDVEFNNAGVLGEKGVTGTGLVALATSPALVTPALGAATGTSLAIGGATLGSNALAVTGLANFASAGSASAPTLSVGNQTTGLYSVSTTGLGITINGVLKGDYGITSSNNWTVTSTLNANNFLAVGSVGGGSTGTLYLGGGAGDTFWSRHAAADWQSGAADAASPVAQKLNVQSVVAGTSNTAGALWSVYDSAGTGSGASGGITFFTHPSGAGATVQNTPVAALNIGTGGALTLATTPYTSCGSLSTNGSGLLSCGSGPVPLSVGGTASISGSLGYYVCTTTCSITLPTPAAGAQFCIRNDSAVTTVITIVAITSVQFEKTTYNGYGTVTTGTMVSGGALGDKICLVGRDATHYLVGSFVGTWTNS